MTYFNLERSKKVCWEYEDNLIQVAGNWSKSTSQGVTLHLSVINRFPFFFFFPFLSVLFLWPLLSSHLPAHLLCSLLLFFCSPVLLSPFTFGVMTASCHYHTSSSDHRANPTAALMTLPTERLSLGSAWTYFRCQFLFVFFYLFIRFLFLLFFCLFIWVPDLSFAFFSYIYFLFPLDSIPNRGGNQTVFSMMPLGYLEANHHLNIRPVSCIRGNKCWCIIQYF